LGFFILPLVIKKSNHSINPVFRRWKYLVYWFGVCALLSVIFYGFPTQINSYILFSYVKYLQELFVLFLVAKITITIIPLEEIINTVIISGIFVLIYSFYELYYGEFGPLEYAPGKYVYKPEGVIWGPFGNTYFHIANFLPLVVIIGISYASKFRGIKKILLYLLSIVIAIPLFYTGSRTGLFLLLFSLIIYIFIRYKFIYSLLISLILFSLVLFTFNEIGSEEFTTLERLDNMETNEYNSIADRILYFVNFDISSYEANGLLVPFIGGGFYVAPIDGHFRIDYGFHNIFIFSFEQAGLIGFILFIYFLIITYRQLNNGLKSLKRTNSISYLFIASVFSYFIASLIIGIAGHTFWRGFTTNNMNTMRLVVIILATNVYFYTSKKQIFKT
jgi:O-antigen ligase